MAALVAAFGVVQRHDSGHRAARFEELHSRPSGVHAMPDEGRLQLRTSRTFGGTQCL